MEIGKPGPRKLMVNGAHVGWFEATGDADVDKHLALARLKELGHEAPHLPPWMRIRQQAMDFRDACGLLMNYNERQRLPHMRPVYVPYLVNSALCVELYLKALSLRHGKEQRGHDLHKLFLNLPPGAVDAINERLDEARKEVGLPEIPDVTAALETIKDTFIDWRYLHEHEQLGTVPMQELRFLRALLHRSCLD
ncbi:TPA: HEPN domain-containing protein [Stenotrophomonas maltophilia]|uniref:HEPN domain-containing protein n=1 Tax=Stenotrophomonas indicatrix TaxID=2045451 RepID=UPI000B430E83|nr:HEPN domain-containing protein [Stenotrophomonas maltophilia]